MYYMLENSQPILKTCFANLELLTQNYFIVIHIFFINFSRQRSITSQLCLKREYKHSIRPKRQRCSFYSRAIRCIAIWKFIYTLDAAQKGSPAVYIICSSRRSQFQKLHEQSSFFYSFFVIKTRDKKCKEKIQRWLKATRSPWKSTDQL